MRLRIYEMGISYRGRTYDEGKKIGMKDGWRALYCILKYNLPRVPFPIQFMFYLLVGGIAAAVNLIAFLALMDIGAPVNIAAPAAFLLAAAVNYVLSVAIVFRHKARWNSATELGLFLLSVVAIGGFDAYSGGSGRLFRRVSGR